MKFVQAARIFEKIEVESSRNTITQLFAELLQQASAQEAQIISYLSLGALFPPYKTLQFNIAKKGIISIIAKALQQSDQVVIGELQNLGDLGSVIAQQWKQEGQDVSLQEVYDSLVACAQIAGTGSTEKKQQSLVDLLQRVDASSAKYIIRIVAGTLRLGFSDMTVLDALSWMQAGDKSLKKKLEHAYNVCADLGLVSYTLKSQGIEGIENMQIQVGIPIRPASAERLSSAQAIIDKLGDCIAQPKLDGFRVQVHVDMQNAEKKVHFFSRNLLDMSDMFPDLKQLVQQLDVQSLIFEGEAIVYDADTDTFLPFQQTVKRKRKHGVEQASQELPLRLYIFDVLYLNGKSLLDKTHKERRVDLQNLLQNVTDESLQIIEETQMHTAEQLHAYFLLNLHAGLEGLVVKREDAIYQPGKRNFNWIKLKRHARGKLVDTIDCVILGYYYGSGKRSQFGIGAFLVGVYNQDLDQFQTVAKIGTGMKDHEWKDLKQRCENIRQETQPVGVQVNKDLYPDVWVVPEIVCTIQSEEITQSPVHTAGKTDSVLGLALRFPRFITYRSDKSSQDATTVEELKSLYKQQTIEK